MHIAIGYNNTSYLEKYYETCLPISAGKGSAQVYIGMKGGRGVITIIYHYSRYFDEVFILCM